MENRSKNVMRIFENLAVRSTAIHQPDPHKWVNGFEISQLVFGIQNELNESVIVQPVGRAGAAQGNLGTAITVDAESEGIISIDLRALWAPWVSVTIKANTAPTSGTITVYAVWK